QAHCLQHFARTLAQHLVRHAVQCAIKPHKGGRRTVIQSNTFGKKAHTPPRGRISEWTAKHPTVTVRRTHEAQCQVNGRSLTCPVRTEKPEDLTRLNAQGKIVESAHTGPEESAPIFLGDTLEFQNRGHGSYCIDPLDCEGSV